MAANQPQVSQIGPSKDYSQFIDFPVEIIGRDGIIREYTFEQSIRLYQYRIRNARLRFHEPMRLKLEIEHCTKRIAQLRRSFFARYAWESFQCVGANAERLSPVIAGEVAAYLRRLFGAGVERPPILIHSLIDNLTETCETTISFSFQVEPNPHLLLLHVFQNTAEYEQYFHSINQTTDTRMVEHLWDSYSVGEIHLVLASDDSKESFQMRQFQGELTSKSQKFLRRGYESLLKGYSTEALDLFITVYERNPYSRGAYWGAAIVADQLRAYAETEFALVMGVNHFPHDSGLQLRLAASYIRRNAPESRNQLHIARQLNGNVPLLKFLALVHQIQDGSVRNPLTRLNELDEPLKRYPGVRRTKRWLVQKLQQRLVNTIFLLSAMAMGIVFCILQPTLMQNRMGIVLFFVLFIFGTLIGYRWYWSHTLKQELLAVKGRQLHLLPSSDLGEILRSLLNSH